MINLQKLSMYKTVLEGNRLLYYKPQWILLPN